MSNEEFANSLGYSSPRYLYKVMKERTPNRELAEKLAAHFDKKFEDYWRPPGQRGRPRAAILPFREFIQEANGEDGLDENLGLVQLRFHLILAYKDREQTPPEDFDSFEALLNFLRHHQIGTEIESRDAALLLWKQFKVWRVREAAQRIVYEIEIGDDVSDDIIRALMAACERASMY
jgi:hypothetical protein